MQTIFYLIISLLSFSQNLFLHKYYYKTSIDLRRFISYIILPCVLFSYLIELHQKLLLVTVTVLEKSILSNRICYFRKKKLLMKIFKEIFYKPIISQNYSKEKRTTIITYHRNDKIRSLSIRSQSKF